MNPTDLIRLGDDVVGGTVAGGIDWSTIIDSNTITAIQNSASSMAETVIPVILTISAITIGIKLLKKYMGKIG